MIFGLIECPEEQFKQYRHRCILMPICYDDLYTITHNNDAIGIIQLNCYFYPEAIVIDNFELFPEYRGKGYSKLIINDLIEAVKMEGKREIMLTPLDTNIVSFWEKFGFRYYQRPEMQLYLKD